jgi:arylsulfatase A-like enzyme
MRYHVVIGITLALFIAFTCSSAAQADDQQNIVLIFVDDLGYGDLGCYGNEVIRTPRIDQLAAEGIRMSDFYAQTVCGPSRTALMTGCYPLRVARTANNMEVHPTVHPDEIMIPELMREAGYKTAAFGKWDMAGHRSVGWSEPSMPWNQGFDRFYGVPSSNDNPRSMIFLDDQTQIEKSVDMNTVTRRYTDAAIDFIEENRDEPFFAYVAHTMPHTILGASDDFRGRSPRGLYGDVIEEIDHNVGRIVDTLEELELTDNTYVFFISDNGPWMIRGENGGSPGPLRGAKTSSWEGGVRVPCIVRAPGRVPEGIVETTPCMTLDMLPTLAALVGVEPPMDRIIDGRDILNLLHGHSMPELQDRPIYAYIHTHLQTVRIGDWKLHVARPAEPAWTPNWAHHINREDVIDFPEPKLYNLRTDIGEQTDVAAEHPEIVARLLELAEAGRNDIGDYDRIGEGARFFDSEPRRQDIER